MTQTRSRFRLAAALAVVLLVAAACGEDDPDPTAAGDTAGTTAETGATGATPSTGSTGGGDMPGYGDAAGGGDDGGGDGDGIDVQANNFSFDPAELEFESGEDIHVKNGNANTPHTFTVDGTDIDVQLGPLEEADVTLDLDPGAYDFHCELHPQMTGTLTIS
jgi:plastocyanin